MWYPLLTSVLLRCLVVSTLTEAEMYAEAGFDDILYGYPLLPGHMDREGRKADMELIAGVLHHETHCYMILHRETGLDQKHWELTILLL